MKRPPSKGGPAVFLSVAMHATGWTAPAPGGKTPARAAPIRRRRDDDGPDDDGTAVGAATDGGGMPANAATTGHQGNGRRRADIAG